MFYVIGLRRIYAAMGVTDCVIRNNWWAAFQIQARLEVHDCEILNGGDYTIRCDRTGDDDCLIDMTNNYWGAGSQAQIEEWIYDSNDDPELCCTVDFIPFDGPVAVEPRSWSGVKGMFRDSGEQ